LLVVIVGGGCWICCWRWLLAVRQQSLQQPAPTTTANNQHQQPALTTSTNNQHQQPAPTTSTNNQHQQPQQTTPTTTANNHSNNQLNNSTNNHRQQPDPTTSHNKLNNHPTTNHNNTVTQSHQQPHQQPPPPTNFGRGGLGRVVSVLRCQSGGPGSNPGHTTSGFSATDDLCGFVPWAKGHGNKGVLRKGERLKSLQVTCSTWLASGGWERLPANKYQQQPPTTTTINQHQQPTTSTNNHCQQHPPTTNN